MLRKIYWLQRKWPENDFSVGMVTSEIQTDQSSNIMIKCLFIFLNIKFLHINFVDKQSPNIKKQKSKKNQVCITLGRTTSHFLMTQSHFPSVCKDNCSMFSPEE